jgi:nucleoside-diphosphate-sugar epimerase
VPGSAHSRQKAYAERALDALEARVPDLRVVRLRPGLVLQRAAGSSIRRLLLGPLVPGWLLRRGLIPVVPRSPGLRFQVVHADVVAAAFRLAALGEARGPFNLATEPVVDADVLAELLSARPVPVPRLALRAVADATWKLRLQPADPGWVDLLLSTPVMDAGRARRELGWSPRWSATDTLADVLAGMREGAGRATGPMHPFEPMADRVDAAATRVGGTDGAELDR